MATCSRSSAAAGASVRGSGAEEPPNALAYLLVCYELTAIGLRKTDLHLLPKPTVVVEQLIHRVLHQFFGVAAGRCSHLAQGGFPIGAEADFHELKIEAARKDVKVGHGSGYV